jgi:hypothetical protein
MAIGLTFLVTFFVVGLVSLIVIMKKTRGHNKLRGTENTEAN